MSSTTLISRRRHYFYVLAFSVMVWLFILEVVGGLIPVKYIETGICECSLHSRYMNISFLIYGFGAIIIGLFFSYPLHRLMLVIHAKPEDRTVPLSKLARWGRQLTRWKGLIAFLFIASAYLACNSLAHRYLFIHPDVSSLEKKGLTSLHCAAIRGDIEDVVLSIQKGTYINSAEFSALGTGPSKPLSEGWTALHIAAKLDYVALAGSLIKNGAEVNPLSNMGYSLKKRNSGIELTGAGVYPNYKTPLDYAVSDKMKSLLRAHGGKTGKEIREQGNRETGQ